MSHQSGWRESQGIWQVELRCGRARWRRRQHLPLPCPGVLEALPASVDGAGSDIPRRSVRPPGTVLAHHIPRARPLVTPRESFDDGCCSEMAGGEAYRPLSNQADGQFVARPVCLRNGARAHQRQACQGWLLHSMLVRTVLPPPDNGRCPTRGSACRLAPGPRRPAADLHQRRYGVGVEIRL